MSVNLSSAMDYVERDFMGFHLPKRRNLRKQTEPEVYFYFNVT